MRAGTKLAGFAAVLGAVFAAASLAGAAIDPSVEAEPDAHDEGAGEISGDERATQARALPGLAVAQDGYRLVPERATLSSEPGAPYAFRIVDAAGETVRGFDLEHERRMHLIVVRRDFAGFQHLHPRMGKDGTWEARVDLSEGGTYRAFADFSTEGRSLTLAADVSAPGRFEPRELPPVATTADAGDGYEVTLESGVLRGGEASSVRFTVSRDSVEVESVAPYLGADGHLVALREHDQAFLHTHPEGEAGGPGPIFFRVEYPSAGRYRLFLQFKHGGEVRTAAFTQEVGGAGTPGAGAEAGASREAGHGREEAGDGGH